MRNILQPIVRVEILRLRHVSGESQKGSFLRFVVAESLSVDGETCLYMVVRHKRFRHPELQSSGPHAVLRAQSDGFVQSKIISGEGGQPYETPSVIGEPAGGEETTVWK